MESVLFILKIPSLLIAFTIHEYAHGWMALKLGDPTARDAGRLTLNPFAHYDLIGTSMALFLPFGFGWAKPVPVNGYNFKKPKRDILLVSAAGPVSNILVAILFGYLFRIFQAYLPDIASYSPNFELFISLIVLLNLGISFFNLLPIPPLDGSKILLSLLPDKWIPTYVEKSGTLPMIFMILLLIDYGFHYPIVSRLFFPLFQPYSEFWQELIFGR